MSDKPQVSEHSAIAESGGSGFIGALIRKIIILAILGGIGYGGYWYFTKKNPDALEKAKTRATEMGDKIGGSVGEGADRKDALEEDIDATR